MKKLVNIGKHVLFVDTPIYRYTVNVIKPILFVDTPIYRQ